MNANVVDKIVVVIDLSRYSDICKELEQQLDVTAVAAVNDQVQQLIGLGLAAASIPPGRPPYKSTGDGAIIVLDTPDEASRFGEKLHQAAESRNRGRDVHLAQRHFRVGMWPGKILLRPESHGKGYPTTFDFAGTAIANAVRLEAACRTGEVLIGSEAWADLAPDVRRLYGPATIGPCKSLIWTQDRPTSTLLPVVRFSVITRITRIARYTTPTCSTPLRDSGPFPMWEKSHIAASKATSGRLSGGLLRRSLTS
jgi:hypothetical protein